jgi:hypothetical protein
MSVPEVAAPATGSTPPPPPGQAEAASVNIEGAAFRHEAVAKVLQRLALIPALQSVRLTSSSLVEPQTDAPADGQSAKRAKPFVTFVVSASLKGGSS